MWQDQLLPLGHYEFHKLQFQVAMEVLPIGLEGSAEAPILEGKDGLFVLVFLLWELPEVCIMFELLVLLVPVLVGEQTEFSISWVEVQPLLGVSRAEK